MGRMQSMLRPPGGNDAWVSWAREVSRALDGWTVATTGSIRTVPGATAPTPGALGPTFGWVFTVAPQCYAYTELALQPNVDRTKPLIVGVAWAATGAEAGKLCKWTVDVGFEYEGSDISAIDASQSKTVDVPTTAISYARTGFIFSPDVWDGIGTDELHVRLTREASGTDPVADTALHHIVLIQQLAP